MPDKYISCEAALMKLMQDGCSAKNLQSISDMPAADVAVVVRCKDCRHSKYAAWCEGYACCRTVGEYHHADFGCTAGKPRTNGVTE